MRRRDLLELGALGGLWLAGCPAAPPAVVAPPTPAPAPAPVDEALAVAEKTVAELAAGMAEGRYTARALVDAYLERIEAIDRSGPKLRAVIEVNPEARAIAEALDDERRDKGARGPLHGIPVLLKDNVATADRMQTTAGSLALVGHRPRRDSFVAARLRQAGAVLLGKTNLSEWANIRSTRSTSGWSSRGGQCKNPYALDRNPCGSSSGSAASVAASLAALAVGTETDGSIMCPSSSCGIVGLKPTVGLVSRAGIVPIAHSQDTAGPMARSVRDAAILLGAIAGIDPDDEETKGAKLEKDYAALLRPDAMKGARIGVARHFFGFHPAVDALMEEALEAMRRLGATLVDPVDLAIAREIHALEIEVLLYEFKAGIARYLGALDAPLKTLADLIAYNEAHRAEVMPYFGQELFLEAQKLGSLDSPGYLQARARIQLAARDQGIDRVMRAERLDAIAAPTSGPAWMTDAVNGDHFLGGSSTPAAIAGYPNVTVPAGEIFGLPVGISLFSGAWSEARLLSLAFAFEQATRHRDPPELAPSAPL
jgi:amidase